MMNSLTHLRTLAAHAIDGHIGPIDDFLFDDQHWGLRYFVVDAGTWLPGRRILISPIAVARVDAVDGFVRLLLTRDQLREAPGTNGTVPISRRSVGNGDPYDAWPIYRQLPRGSTSAAAADLATTIHHAAHATTSHNNTPNLHSVRALSGCCVTGRDGQLGCVRDALSDNGNWTIRYLVVEISDLLPCKCTLVSPHWADDVAWQDARVGMGVAREQIVAAPAYHHPGQLDRAYEQQLHSAFQRAPYWDGG